MTPPSMREANISPVTAGTKAPHNQNTLTVEPKAPSFTAITLTGQKSSALNFSREFLRECVPQIAFFRTFFSKKKVHKGKAFAESPFRRRLQTLAHLQIPPSRRRLLGLLAQTSKSLPSRRRLQTLAHLHIPPVCLRGKCRFCGKPLEKRSSFYYKYLLQYNLFCYIIHK